MQIPLLTELLILAQEGGEAPPLPQPSILNSPMVLILGIFFIFWFLIIRPQMKRQKEHQERVGGLKKGDQVVTQGGLVGKVIKVGSTRTQS